tara:strand:+ start:4640 stop:5602 length:963 start_codon:yes stop_codon:yes gene_type:complete
MNKLKKVGLTALGTVLVSAGAASAADMSVTGSTSLFFNGEDNSNMGNGWSMTDSLSFAASGEMDNGWTVSTSIEVDGNTMDDRSLTIDTGEMGKLTFSGSGTSGPIGAWDDLTPSANEEAHGTAVSGTADGPVNSSSMANAFVYDLDLANFFEGLALKASYAPSATTTKVESSTEYGLSYSNGGLSINAGMGENNDQISTGTAGSGKIDVSVFYVGYAMDNGLSIGYQVNENDSATANEDEDFTAIGVSYAVSDDISISYNISEIDYESSTLEDQEAQGISASITNGGMTISGTYSTVDNTAGSSTADNTGYELNIAFAF